MFSLPQNNKSLSDRNSNISEFKITSWSFPILKLVLLREAIKYEPNLDSLNDNLKSALFLSNLLTTEIVSMYGDRVSIFKMK